MPTLQERWNFQTEPGSGYRRGCSCKSPDGTISFGYWRESCMGDSEEGFHIAFGGTVTIGWACPPERDGVEPRRPSALQQHGVQDTFRRSYRECPGVRHTLRRSNRECRPTEWDEVVQWKELEQGEITSDLARYLSRRSAYTFRFGGPPPLVLRARSCRAVL
jgi:hypothetical protein